MKITKEDFEDYEKIRQAGLTNMFNVSEVINLSYNLTKEKVFYIMKNYSKLKEKFK